MLLWHPSEYVVILGAALGAFITSNSLKVVKASFAGALGLVKPLRYNRDTYVELLKLVFDLLVKSRKEGLLAIENDIADPAKSPVFSKYPKVLEDHHMIEFITDCMRGERASPRIERAPSARGPNSMRPLRSPTILPSASASAMAFARSSAS